MTEFPTVRSVPEWIGDTPDTAPPPRVKLRVFEREKGKCHNCGRKIMAGEIWTCEHLIAIENGGENREGNLGCTCPWCVADKNAADAAIKKKGTRVRQKHFGVKQPSRTPMPFGKKDKRKRKLDGTIVPRDR